MDAPVHGSTRVVRDASLPMSMRALVRDRDGVRVAERPTPRGLADDEALVRVAVAGLCRTDLLVADGVLGAGLDGADAVRVLGHEVAGTVVARGPEVAVELGVLVSVDPRVACGGCSGCAGGHPCLAPRLLGVDLDGGFADYLRVPAGCLVPIPNTSVDLRAAAYVEPIAASLAVLDTGIRPDQRGLVLGDGRIATLTLELLRHHGYARVEALAPESASARPADAFDFVIETRNDPASLAAAVRLLRPRGRLVLKSRSATPLVLDPLALIRKRLELVAADYGSFTAAAALIGPGGLDLSGLWTEPRPLDAHAELFAAARAGEGRKLFFTLA